MSIHQNHKLSTPHQNGFVINTDQELWVIPDSCELLKTLLKERNIRVEDLQFGSQTQCHCFLKKLFLLALEDEYKTCAPSSLAEFARKLIAHRHSTQKY